MGISHKAVPAVEGSLRFNRAQLLEFEPDDRSDRRTDTPGRLEFTDKKERTAEQPISADLRERILALYDEYRPRLFRYIRSMNLSRDKVEEVIQETFLRLTTQLMREDEIENVQGWIVRVAHNFAVDMLKRNDRDSAGTSDHIFALETYVDPTPNPEEAYSKKEQIRRVQAALSTLNQQQRQCFDLRARGFRYKDIALTFGISEQRAAFIVKQVAVRLAAICG
jgi:RNA polymerase sigma-70 factor, ECF subfamily